MDHPHTFQDPKSHVKVSICIYIYIYNMYIHMNLFHFLIDNLIDCTLCTEKNKMEYISFNFLFVVYSFSVKIISIST